MIHQFSSHIRPLLAAGVALAMIAAALPAFAPGQVTPAYALTNCDIDSSEVARDAEEIAFLALINAFRANPASKGYPDYPVAPPLSFSSTLDRPAAWHANDMGAKKYFAHTEPGGRTFDQRMTQCGYAWTAAGENIAAGNNTDTAAEAFNLWLNSTGHRNNMMKTDFTEIGIARDYGSCPNSAPFNGQGSCWYWSTDFGKPMGGGTVTPTGPIFQFTSSSYSASESTGGIDAVVQRIGGTGSASVTCRTTSSGSSATAGTDYTAGDVTLTFTASETQKSCRIPVVNDDLSEPSETIKVNLVSPTGNGVLGSPTSTTLTILNDDTAPVAPELDALNPGSVVVAVPDVVASVSGSNFTAASEVRINGSARTTEFVNATELRVTVTSGDVTAVGNRSVTVYTPGAGTSNSLNLAVVYSSSDYNCNGGVTSGDVLLALQSLAGIPESSACGTFNPDGSSGVTMADVLKMRKVVAGLMPQ